MALNKLDNFIKNVEGRILYVNPNDLDATDSIENQGNSLARPFKTIQRALLESARFSYLKGDNNDITEKTTVLVFPGEHLVDNRPGYAIYNNSGAAYAVSRSGGIGSPAADILSLGLDSIFDLTQPDNILYKFNSFYGGVIIPRGTSIVGLDLRKTKVRPKYVPNPTDPSVARSSIFKITGACYFWQFSFFDGDETGLVYTDPNDFSDKYKSTPLFSHHKLACFEYADGVNKVNFIGSSNQDDNYGLTDLDMYYSKVSNAFNAYRSIDDKFPSSPGGFAKRLPEWEIVGAFASDPLEIDRIYSGDGSTPSSLVTVRTKEEHRFNSGTPIKVRDVVGAVVDSYNISTKVQAVLDSKTFTYLLPSFPANLSAFPSVSSATVTVETDTVGGASPYVFNCSLRSVWGMNGMIADGNKASGFKSMVVAQFTGVSLQKDDRAFAKYNKSKREYDTIDVFPVYGSDLPTGASQTDSNLVYHLDSEAIYRSGWESSHIKIINNSFIQIVSVFAIGYTKHFDVQSGGDASITNSNSNFGQISLSSDGFRNESFNKDDQGYITSIITPREVSTFDEEDVFWVSLDVGLTTSTTPSATPNRLYLRGYTSEDIPPTSITQGYRIGARLNDKIYANINDVQYSASIYMPNILSNIKTYSVSSVNDSYLQIGTHSLESGEKIIITSDDGNLPENIEEHKIYYAVAYTGVNATKIRLASSFSNALSNNYIGINGGTNLVVSSRVSEKDSGDLGSPIQFDSTRSNWYINVDSGNSIYSQFASLGTAVLGESTDISYVKRIVDDRSLDEKIYKIRVVIPKQLQNAKNPETGFVLQESSSTNLRTDTDFGLPVINSIDTTDYGYNRNPRFISTCSYDSVNDIITVTAEQPHNLNVNDIIIIKNVKSTTNTTGKDNEGFNGTFRVLSLGDDIGNNKDLIFKYSYVDIFDIAHNVGNFTSDTNIRNNSLPRFIRNDLQSNLYIYRNEIISPYVENVQDGIYHLYVLNADNSVSNEFTSLKYSQSPVDLYPQLDRDNLETNPRAARSYAKVSPLGSVVTNDLKKSITRESLDILCKSFGVGLSIESVISSPGISTVTFNRDHGLNGVVSGILINTNSGFTGVAGTYYNVKLLDGGNDPALYNWRGGTVKVKISGGSIDINSIEVISGGSDYSVNNELFFDKTKIGAGGAKFKVVGISSNSTNTIQFTGSSTSNDCYARITNVLDQKTVSVTTSIGDPDIVAGQYAFVVGPSIRISSSGTSYDSVTKETTFTTTSSHGLLAGNKFRVNTSSNVKVGDYVVSRKISETQFSAITNASISASSGFILKHGFSSNDAISDSGGENLGIRGISFFDNEYFVLGTSIDSNISSLVVKSGISTSNRLPLGSYIQIDNEIMRISSASNTVISVFRGSLGTRPESHTSGALVRKIKPLAVEFRRPSILRASGHTFEYLGYGPGNYSTGLPQVQVKTISDRESFLSQSQERSCGTVIYNGINNSGDIFNGNTKTSAASGEVISFDIPKPTVTGQDSSKLSAVFDEVTIKERLLVEGGNSGNILSQFDGPVTFSQNVRIKGSTIFNSTLKITDTTQSTSKTNGALVVSGGVGIGSDVNIGGDVTILGNGSDSNSLTVTGSIYVDGTPSGEDAIILNNGTIKGTHRLIFNDPGAGEGIVWDRGNGWGIYESPNTFANASGNLQFVNGEPVSTDVLISPRKRVFTLYVNGNADFTGNLGVGVQSPTERLDIDGNIKATGDIVIVGNATFGTVGAGNSHVMRSDVLIGRDLWVNGDTFLGESGADDTIISGTLYVKEDIYAFWTSDERLKDNVTPIQNPLEKVLLISGNTFEWNEESNRTGKDVGVIAQEIEKVLPEIVTTRDSGYKAVDYQKIVPLLIEAIKELSNKVESLEQKLIDK